MYNVYFVSGNLLIDYFITLPKRCLAELAVSKLELRVKKIYVNDEIELSSV